MRGWFLFRCKLHSKKHTLLQVSFQRRGYLSMLTGQTFQRVKGGLHGVIDTYMVFPDRAKHIWHETVERVTRLLTTSWTPNFFFWENSIGWLSLRRLGIMSDESWRWKSMLRQANILQPATVEAMREANLRADYRLISELLWDRSFIRSWRKTRLETECSFPITRSTATKVIYLHGFMIPKLMICLRKSRWTLQASKIS